MTPAFLSALYIYPIKSAGGISLASSAVTPRGLALDRRWLVLGPDGRMLTRREFPRMAQLQVQLAGSGLQVSAPGMAPLLVPAEASGPVLHSDIWGQPVWGRSVDEASAWLSAFLRPDCLTPGCQLIQLPEALQRWQQGKPYRSLLSFADGNPFHLISEASLRALNEASPLAASHREFRPNLVVSGDLAPYREDHWRLIRLGTLEFEVVESTDRCSMVNVDGQGRMTAEPLRTLARLRRVGKRIPFGQHLVQHAPEDQRSGVLRVGDPLEVLREADTPNPFY